MVKVVSFDADGTLVDKCFMDSFWNVGIPEEYSREKGMSFHEAKAEVERRYEEVGEEDIRWYTPDYWFQLLGLKITAKELMESYKNEVKVYPEVTEILEELGERYPLVVISNAPREILSFELLELEGYFAHVFSATTDFKEVRKTTDFYSNVCRLIGVKPGELAHVGDHWNFDYIVPRRLGIKTYFLDRDRVKKGKNVVKDLREFKEKLEPF
ncbi:MAG: HAD family hydrolase [Candidatus Hydrothermarchaeales archaeon]